MSDFDMDRARYWADIDTESGDHVDERGMRIARLATQDWRGHWLREALDEMERLRDLSSCSMCATSPFCSAHQPLTGQIDGLRADRDRLAARVAELEQERDMAFAKVDSLYASIEAGTSHKTALRFGDMMLAAQAERDSALADAARMRELLVEALAVIDDWPECPDRNQHTNTIHDIEMALWTPGDETLQPFRDAISTAKGGDKP